jgi:hypothetical protein
MTRSVKKLSVAFAVALGVVLSGCGDSGHGPMGPSADAPAFDYSVAWPVGTGATTTTTIKLGTTVPVTTTTTTTTTSTTSTTSLSVKSDFGLAWPQ